MRERTIENYLTREVVKRGGRTKKLTSKRGDPDRIVLWPAGTVCKIQAKTHYVEMKAPYGELSDIQRFELGKLKGQGFAVYVLWTKEHVDLYIKSLFGEN